MDIRLHEAGDTRNRIIVRIVAVRIIAVRIVRIVRILIGIVRVVRVVHLYSYTGDFKRTA